MDDKLFELTVNEAIELTKKTDFKKYTTAKFKKNMGIVHTSDYLKGLKIGYTVATVQSLFNEKKFDELLTIVKKFLNNTDKIQSS